jgi:plexin A
MITDFTPKNGSSKGGTRVDITGTNLGTQLSDIISITIGSSRSCSSISTYVPGQRIICTITDDTNGIDISDSIRVTIRNSQSQNLTATSNGVFELLTPVIGSIIPTLGPVSGGTKVIVMGMNLNIGNQEETRVIMRETVNKRTSSLCPDVSCTITSIDSNEIRCTSDPTVNTTCSRAVAVSINGNDADLANNAMVTYSYRNDPTFDGVSPQQTIPAGGVNLTFMGTNVDIIQSPMIAINDSRFPASSIESCVSTSGTTLICTAPTISSPIGNSDYGQPVSYQLILDGAPSPDSNMFQLRLILRPNPNITGVSEMITADDSGAYEITIQGSNFMSVDQSEIMITLIDINNPSETHTCEIQTLSDSKIDCMAPSNKPIGTTLSVQVKIGNLMFPMDGSNRYTVTYTQAVDATLAPILGGVAGGIIVIVIVLVLCISIPVAFAIRRHSKKKDLQFNNLLSQMESMELDITDQCKQAFAELQTELGELVADDAADLHQLPFHDFPTYATKVFFPSAGVHHPVLSPPRVPSNMTKEDLSSLLEEFRTLVFDKKFLIAFVKTLESQPKFNLQEKSTMASLIMVACLNDISYATDILQTLLSDLIRRSLSNTRNHPKLLLRRTESVAEKLLTNWFCVTLFPYMLEHAGAPMYILFKAVKAQLEKGPIDVITGEARNSLSEEKLLRQALEFKVMECEVELGNASSLLAHTKKQEQPLENDSPHIETVQTIRLLDTDSISQTKEKILDFIYCNRPVSMRPSIGEVELELCRGNAGIPLKDQDTTSARDGEWMKINTLGHYNILEMSEAAVEDPKKLLPRFRLTPRLMSPIKPGMRPMSGAGYDVPGTIVASASITSQTSLLASVNQLPSFDTNTRLYHLIKSQEASDGQGQQKIVSEVFLTRLLSTKRILQSYVDNLFKAIFGIPHGKPLPKSIKVMFDFLDIQAAELGIHDPEVLHTWKTNTLPLRFWVNLIKNPDFVFDINKSATVDACFTVIAQAYIDGCSTAEVRYTKDTPSARLLYANEVKQYKQEVLQFYDKVQSLPRTTNDELRSYFTEMVDVSPPLILLILNG